MNKHIKVDNLNLKNNENDRKELESLLNSIDTWTNNQYGLVKSYEKEKNCSFGEAVFNTWFRNRVKIDLIKFL